MVDVKRCLRLWLFRFSLLLYTSLFVLWGSVASEKYLKGDFLHGHRLSGGEISEEAGRHIVESAGGPGNATRRRCRGSKMEENGGKRLVSQGFRGVSVASDSGEVVWNPFPKSAFIGIIIASLSQSLQCLIVAPRLLQNMAKERTTFVSSRSQAVSPRRSSILIVFPWFFMFFSMFSLFGVRFWTRRTG